MTQFNEVVTGEGLVIDPTRDQSLRTIGHISYALHAIVAVGAVVPGFQPSLRVLLSSASV